jgi:hypothetical protein
MAMAKRNLTRALEAQPVHALSNSLRLESPGLGCTVCPAMYPMSPELPVLCARCGGRRQVIGACTCCGHTGVLPVPKDMDNSLATITCPTCRRGSLSQRELFEL